MTPTLNVPLDELGKAYMVIVDGEGELVAACPIANPAYRCEWTLELPSTCSGGRLEISPFASLDPRYHVEKARRV